jgi:hypothetical protein
MLKEFFEVGWKLVTGGMTPQERASGIKFMVTAGWRAMTLFVVAWGFGFMAWTGSGSGFARASDVDKKIATALEPIVHEQKEQKTLLTVVSRKLTEQLANAVASEIRYLYAKKCAEQNPVERDRLQREIDRKQSEYIELKDERYQYNCGDV